MSHVLMGVTGSNKTPSCRGCRGRSLVMFSWWFVSTAAAAKRVKSSLCLHIRPLVFEHCSSFTQTLILLRTSVRLHQYGEDEASLGFLFLFLKRKNSRQHNRSDDSLAVLQLETWTEFCPVSGEGGGTDGRTSHHKELRCHRGRDDGCSCFTVDLELWPPRRGWKDPPACSALSDSCFIVCTLKSYCIID